MSFLADSIILMKEKESRDKQELEKIMDDKQEDLEKELSLQSDRADKRHKRALDIAKDHEDRLRKLEEFMYYSKGKEVK